MKIKVLIIKKMTGLKEITYNGKKQLLSMLDYYQAELNTSNDEIVKSNCSVMIEGIKNAITDYNFFKDLNKKHKQGKITFTDYLTALENYKPLIAIEK
jgi:uncharacterized protein YbcV (DUF1398 family)